MKFKARTSTRLSALVLTWLIGLCVFSTVKAEDYIGEIKMVGFSFCPAGTLEANGQTLDVNQYMTLYALLGTYYGGDGMTTFKLPNFQGRVPVGEGIANGIFPKYRGETGGSETITLIESQLPSHSHTATINASTASGDSPSPATNTVLAANSAGNSNYTTSSSNVSLSPESVQVSATGAGIPIWNMQPYLVIKYCIVTDGMFPSRS